MKYIYLIAALLFLGSCGNTDSEKEINSDSETAKKETAVKEEVKEKLPIQNLLGTWFADAETAGAYIEMTLKEGGAMDYEIAGQKDERTYEIINDSMLQVGTQVWTFSNVTNTNADVSWKSKNRLGKTIPFTKK